MSKPFSAFLKEAMEKQDKKWHGSGVLIPNYGASFYLLNRINVQSMPTAQGVKQYELVQRNR